MMISSPYDSRLTVMEHLQGLFAYLRITEEKVCTKTKEDIYNAVDQVQRYRHREKRSLLGAQGDAETKKLKFLECDDCSSDRLDLESDEITWAYHERLEKQIEMFENNTNLQNDAVDLPDGNSKKRKLSKQRKKCDISYPVQTKAQSTDRQYNVKAQSTASVDRKKSAGHAHIVEPVKDLREKLMHKRNGNQVTVRKGETKMPNTDKRSYKTDNIQITVPTEYIKEDTLVRKRIVSLVDIESNDQGRLSTEKLSKTVDKVQFIVPTKDTQCKLKTNVSIIGEKTNADLTKNLAKHCDKVDNAKITSATYTNLKPNIARQCDKVDNTYIKMAPELTQRSLVPKTTVSLGSWLKNTRPGLQRNEKKSDKNDNTQISMQTKDKSCNLAVKSTSSFVGERKNIDFTSNIAKHSDKVGNACTKNMVPEITQSNPIPTTTVSLADETINRDLTPKVAKHTVDNAGTKVVREFTERNPISRTVSLAGEKTTKDLTQEITKCSDKVDNSCSKVAQEATERNPIPKRTVITAGEMTIKDLTQEITKHSERVDNSCSKVASVAVEKNPMPKRKVGIALTQEMKKHSDSIDNTCSKVSQVVTERNLLPKRTVSLAGEKTTKGLTSTFAKQQDKVDNVCIKKVAPELTKSNPRQNRTGSLACEKANKDLAPKLAKQSDKIDNDCTKVTPEVTKNNPMPKTKVSLIGEKINRDLTPKFAKHTVDNECTKVVPEDTERNPVPKRTVCLAGEKTAKDLTQEITKHCDKNDNARTKVASKRNVITNKTVRLAGGLKKTRPELQSNEHQSDKKAKVHMNIQAKYTLNNSRKAGNLDGERTKEDLSTKIAEHMDQLNKLKTILSAKETNNLVRKRTHSSADEKSSEESLPKIARQSDSSLIKVPTSEAVKCRKTISLVNVKKSGSEMQSAMTQSDKSNTIQNNKPSKDEGTLIRKRTINMTCVKSDGNASTSIDMGSEKKKKFQINLIKF